MSNPKNDINFLRAKIKRLESLLNKKDVPIEESINNVSGSLKNLKDSLDSLDLSNRFTNYDFDFGDLKGFKNGIFDGSNIPSGLLSKFADKNLFDNTKLDFDKIKAGDLSIANGLKGILDGKALNSDLTKIKTGDLTDAIGLKDLLDNKTGLTDFNKLKDGDLVGLGATGLKGLFDDKTSVADFNKLKTGDLDGLGATGLRGLFDDKASNAALNLKANSANVYTKTETDTALGLKANSANVYTKTESDTNFRTAAQVNSAISSFDFSGAGNATLNTRLGTINTTLGQKANSANVYTKTETDTALGLKANSANVYTKTETDTALGLKANSANVYTKTEVDNSLGLKANTANVYSKTESDTNFRTAAQVNSAIGGFDFSGTGNATINSRFGTVNTTLGQKANSADVYSKTDANNTFRTAAQVNSAIGSFDFSGAGNASFNTRLLGTENKVGSIGLTAKAGSANSGFGGFYATAGSQGWNYLGSNAMFTIALASASLAANAGTDVPQFSLALERNAYYLGGFMGLQGRTETDVQKFITYDMDIGDSRGDLTLNAGSVFIKGDDSYGSHLAHFTHNRGALIGGSNNGGAVYFGISAGDNNNSNTPTAGIETSWNNASSPRIGIGVTRDGNRASIVMDYGAITTFYTNNTSRFYVNSNGDVNPISPNAYSLGTSGQYWKSIYVAVGGFISSDERKKKDIENSDLGLQFINELRPVKYKYKVRENKIETSSDGKETIEELPGVRPHYGFIAQEVKKILGDKDFAGYAHDPETDYYGLRYDEFISPMVKAIQELSQKNDYLEKKLEEKDKQLQDILLRLSALEGK